MPNTVSLADALEQFLVTPYAKNGRERYRSRSTVRKYRQKLRQLLELYGDRPIAEIGVAELATWARALEEAYSEGTCAFARSCVVALFNWAHEGGLIVKSPARSLPRYSQVPRHVKVANRRHLQQALEICEQLSYSSSAVERRDACMFALAAVSGMRRSNLLAIPYRDTLDAINHPIDHPDVGALHVVVVRGGKEPMELVFGPWHRDMILRYVEKLVGVPTKGDRLFVNLDPYQSAFGRPVGQRVANQARWRVCQAANVPIITYQELRRLKGTEVARKFGLELAAHVLGHRSGVDVIRRHYYDPDRDAARVAALRTAVAFAPLPETKRRR